MTSAVDTFVRCISLGALELVFDQGHRDVVYPSYWPNRLPFQNRIGVGWDTYSIQAVFSAGEERHTCKIPWHTVLEIHSLATGQVEYTRPPYGTVVPIRAARTRRPIVRRNPAPGTCHLRVVT